MVCNSENIKTYCIDRRHPTKDDQLILLEECNGICSLCGATLMDTQAKKKTLFEIAHIFPNSPTAEELIELDGVELSGNNSEDIQNWIMLCSKCHKEYDYHKTKKEYLKLLNIKQKLCHSYNTKHLLSLKSIEPELTTVVSKLCQLTNNELSELEKLNYHALCISEKIENVILGNEISRHVIDYYIFIRELFSIQEQNGGNYLEVIATNIKHAYYNCKQNQLDESQIFDELVKWLMQKVHCERVPAQIIISFFVQNCDVYEKLSK